MTAYAGFDVSDKMTTICVVDAYFGDTSKNPQIPGSARMRPLAP